jgi:uncharacterized protein (TIGR03066 family)
MRAICILGSILLSAANLSADEKDKEDLKAAVVGKWVSRDDEQLPLEFFKDGTAKVGFIKRDGKWLIGDGTWTISEKGRVECDATHGGVRFGQWWNLKDGELIGPRGPKPIVTWVKVKEKEK